jgi:hypothetical protein
MIKLKQLIEQEEPKENKEFIEFSKKRLEGATKIVTNAKEKGGPSILTYHHFVVKLPYYEKATKGEFDVEGAKNELRGYMEELCGGQVKMDQIGFQRLVGLIEVLGELLIQHKEINND